MIKIEFKNGAWLVVFKKGVATTIAVLHDNSNRRLTDIKEPQRAAFFAEKFLNNNCPGWRQ